MSTAFLLALWLLVQSPGQIPGQDPGQTSSQESGRTPGRGVEAQILFSRIEKGIAAVDAAPFEDAFAAQTYVSVGGKETGYFGSHQAPLIIHDFLAGKHVLSFRFSKINETGDAPYATGGGVWMNRGSKELFQMYVGLARAGNRWVITQFHIY